MNQPNQPTHPIHPFRWIFRLTSSNFLLLLHCILTIDGDSRIYPMCREFQLFARNNYLCLSTRACGAFSLFPAEKLASSSPGVCSFVVFENMRSEILFVNIHESSKKQKTLWFWFPCINELNWLLELLRVKVRFGVRVQSNAMSYPWYKYIL